MLGPRPLGPWDLRCQGLKVRGPKVRVPMGQGLIALEINTFGKFIGCLTKVLIFRLKLLKHTLKRPFCINFMLKKPHLKVQLLQYNVLDRK